MTRMWAAGYNKSDEGNPPGEPIIPARDAHANPLALYHIPSGGQKSPEGFTGWRQSGFHTADRQRVPSAGGEGAANQQRRGPMEVRTIMSAPALTVSEDESMLDATRLMKDKKIKHLPVVNAQGELKGVVTDRDLKRASASDATTLEIHELLYLLHKVKVREVMTKKPLTAPPDLTASGAADLMVRNKVGCLPVLEGRVLVGIVTKDDLLRLLAKG